MGYIDVRDYKYSIWGSNPDTQGEVALGAFNDKEDAISEAIDIAYENPYDIVLVRDNSKGEYIWTNYRNLHSTDN